MSIYLDNAATSYPKPETIYQAVMYAMKEIGASPGRGGYRSSLEAGRLLFQARESVSALFSIPDSSRVIFTSNATESLNMALRGVLQPGDHVITTSMEHNSMVRPLAHLRRQGVHVTIVATGSSGIVDPDDIRRALTPATHMIALAHVSNVCGVIQPIAALSGIAREADALLLLDAAQSAGSIDIDVEKMGIDLLAAPGHKGLFGPPGTGILYAAPSVRLRPLLYGGTGGNSTDEEQPDSFPEGFEAGTCNLSGIAGLKAGVEYVLEQGASNIGKKECRLLDEALEQLKCIDGIQLHAVPDISSRAGVLSMTLRGTDPGEVAFYLDNYHDISVRAGLHCAPDAHRTIGTFPGGTVRISPGWFTTSEEIAIFSDAIVQCARSSA